MVSSTTQELSYSEKLKDPRWQRKRLEILQRDNWACQICGSSHSTLMVHHRWYQRGFHPWEYPNNSLITLCEECHEGELEEHSHLSQDWSIIQRSLWPTDIQTIAVALSCREHWDYSDPVIAFACWILEHPTLLNDISLALKPLMSERMFKALTQMPTRESPDAE